ncbi:MAG: sigma-70 family RNA polymerase sigma factor [Clostridiales bacterium]|nr:sigma-70 family RNA polymerase sigma factor [Clostridiales bacterium]
MEDKSIIELYFSRDENAISESQKKYGSFCHAIAWNLLESHEDSEECVNDTMLAAWNAIPPTRPNSLRAFLGGITRKLALMVFRKRTAKKRNFGIMQSLDELFEIVPSSQNVEKAIEMHELSKIIDHWLDSLAQKDRVLFVRRYWFGDAVSDLANKAGMSSNQLSQKLFALRKQLKTFLEKEGVAI